MTGSPEQFIFVVDDESKVCEAIRETLEESGAKVTCFARATECLERLRCRRCDLLITDLRMPEMDGIELLTNARAIAPWLPVLMITGYGDIPTAVQAVKAGVVDFIEKPLAKDDFLRKVKSILQDNPSAGASVAAPLTPRETRVLELIIEGKTNQEIADLLHRSIRTIEVHRSRVMNKLDAENLIDLLKRAAAIGLVDLPAKQEPDYITRNCENHP
ncbi:MAG: response regulator transcription factor [Desulfobacteraceae bacterium]|nr:response regulator transcription factor [Desulfobacteraceae bacterium]